VNGKTQPVEVVDEGVEDHLFVLDDQDFWRSLRGNWRCPYNAKQCS
jgi:hypothetical protein